MSKFIDRLKELSRPPSTPIGFGRTQTYSKKARILLIASLDSGKKEGLSGCIDGADAVLLTVSDTTKETVIKNAAKAIGDIPWGGRLNDGDAATVEKLVKVDGDFIFFKPETTNLDLLKFDKLGKVLVIEPSLPDNLVRAINGLPADAVYLNAVWEGKPSLTWNDLLLFRKFADLLSKPLLVSVPDGASGKDLVVLWEAGVTGIVIPATEKIKALREEIDKLTFPPQRKAAPRGAAVLPHLSPQAFAKPEEAEPEEEPDEDE